MTVAVRDPIVSGSPLVDGMAVHGARRALFLDRDGVVNINHGYVHTPEQTEWVPGIFELARSARDAGLVIVIVTNQAGIARGYYSEAQFEAYTRWMHDCFAREGAPLLATYYCPHHPEFGLGELRVSCECRKPKPGMLLHAGARFGLDLRRSIMLGDKPSDAEAAHAAGVGTYVGLDGVVPSLALERQA